MSRPYTGTRRVVREASLHKVKVPLAHAVTVGNLVFVSGTPPYKTGPNANYREMAVGDFGAQFKQSMTNLKASLEASGSSLERVVKVGVFLSRSSDFTQMNELYREYWSEDDWPARTTIVVGHVVPDMLLEIECVAELLPEKFAK
jgi:2-iminobutanoate/2-iminopropanoate deaminase